MISLIEILLSIVNSLFSITMLMLPLLMMKNYNLIIKQREYDKNIVIRMVYIQYHEVISKN